MQGRLGERMASSMLILACFTLLAWLNGRYVANSAAYVALYSVLGVALACVFLLGLAGLVYASAPPLRPWGFPGAWSTVTRGFLVLLPLTALALLADLVFGWSAAQAFTQAGIMMSGAAVGAEVMRRVGPSMKYMAAPLTCAFCFSFAWIGFTVLFSRAVW